MIRKNMKPRIARDRRGKITVGRIGLSKTGKEIPQSLNHFNIDKFPELIEVYGNKPDSLLIVFPSNQIEDFLSSQWSEWGKGKGDVAIMKRSCDGEQYVDRINGDVEECNCPAGICNKGLSCYTGLKAYVCDPSRKGMIISPVCYPFQTMSPNSGDNLYYGIKPIWDMTGGKLIGVFFWIRVRMVEKITDGQKTKFPILDIQAVGDLPLIKVLAERGIQPTSQENAIDIPLYGGKTPNALQEPSSTQEIEQPQDKIPGFADVEREKLIRQIQEIGVLSEFEPHKDYIYDAILKGNDRSFGETIALIRFFIKEVANGDDAECNNLTKEHGTYYQKQIVSFFEELKTLSKDDPIHRNFAEKMRKSTQSLYKQTKLNN